MKSKISYSTDTWTTKQMVFSFAGTIAHYITDDWKLKQRLIAFDAVSPDDHKGIESGLLFAKGVAAKGGLDKISSVQLRDLFRHANEGPRLLHASSLHGWCTSKHGPRCDHLQHPAPKMVHPLQRLQWPNLLYASLRKSHSPEIPLYTRRSGRP